MDVLGNAGMNLDPERVFLPSLKTIGRENLFLRSRGRSSLSKGERLGRVAGLSRVIQEAPASHLTDLHKKAPPMITVPPASSLGASVGHILARG